MKGSEFKRRVERLAKATGQKFVWDPKHGKCSHGRVHYGAKSTTLKDHRKEIGTGLLLAMCEQLGIDKKSL